MEDMKAALAAFQKPKIVPPSAELAHTAPRELVVKTDEGFPEHVWDFLSVIETKFAIGQTKETRLDDDDVRDYARQVIRLTQGQTREAAARLRERHTFRPSVAEVRVVVLEITGKESAGSLPGAVAQSRRTLAEMHADWAAEDAAQSKPLLLGSVTDDPAFAGREGLRNRMQKLRETLPPSDRLTAAQLKTEREKRDAERRPKQQEEAKPNPLMDTPNQAAVVDDQQATAALNSPEMQAARAALDALLPQQAEPLTPKPQGIQRATKRRKINPGAAIVKARSKPVQY